MEESQFSKLVPQQETGKAIDAKSSIEFNTTEEAKSFFSITKSRLQHVNDWHRLAGEFSAAIQLVDEALNKVTRGVQKGDYFKIDIPGPGTKSGAGYDWVQIEEVEESSDADSETFGFRVRPVSSPETSSTDISHFYTEDSTSTFMVTREGNQITAAVYDRNTHANTDVEKLTDQARNAVVGITGKIAGSKIQWKTLTNAIVKA